MSYADYSSKVDVVENDLEILHVNAFLIGNKLTALIGDACNECCEVEVSTYIANCTRSHVCNVYRQYYVLLCGLHVLGLKFASFSSL